MVTKAKYIKIKGTNAINSLKLLGGWVSCSILCFLR